MPPSIRQRRKPHKRLDAGIAERRGIPSRDATTVRIFRLQPEGQSAEVTRSEVFPQIDIAAIGPFLAQGKDRDYVSTMRRFREWIREQLERGERAGG